MPNPSEIGCVNPKVIIPMVIFTVPHIPWNFKPILVLKAHIPKLIRLLKEKLKMGILEPSNAPYLNWVFTVAKKNGSLRFIQDLQPINKVTIQNSGVGPMVDSFAEAFAGHAIYSMGDLFSGYYQFQLALDSRDTYYRLITCTLKLTTISNSWYQSLVLFCCWLPIFYESSTARFVVF